MPAVAGRWPSTRVRPRSWPRAPQGTPTSSARCGRSSTPRSAFDHSHLHRVGDGAAGRSRGPVDRGAIRPPDPRSATWRCRSTPSPVHAVDVGADLDRGPVGGRGGGPDGSVPGVSIDDDAAATRLRVTVLGAAGRRRPGPALGRPDRRHDISRSLVAARAECGPTPPCSSPARRRGAPAWSGRTTRSWAASSAWQRETSETPGFDRTITVGDERRVAPRRVVRSPPTVRPLEQLVAPLAEDQVRRRRHLDVRRRPGGRRGGRGRRRGRSTGWTSAPGDPAPALQLSWGPRRRIVAASG